MITLTLTYPPSANRIWRTYRGKTVKSEEYTAWIALNSALVLRERFQQIAGHFRCTIIATAPDKRRRDIDNLAKPTMDLLQRIGAIADDCHCRALNLAWLDGPKGSAGVTVTVEPIK